MLLNRDSDIICRCKYITLIVHWYGRMRNWPVVRSLHEGVITEIKLTESKWSSDSHGPKTMSPSVPIAPAGEIGVDSVKNRKQL